MTTRHLPPGECSRLLGLRGLFLRESCPASEDCQGPVTSARRPLVPRSGQQNGDAHGDGLRRAQDPSSAPTNGDNHTTNRSCCGTDGVTSGPAASRYTLISLRTPKRPVRYTPGSTENPMPGC